jgi:hypothetical protein
MCCWPYEDVELEDSRYPATRAVRIVHGDYPATVSLMASHLVSGCVLVKTETAATEVHSAMRACLIQLYPILPCCPRTFPPLAFELYMHFSLHFLL